MLSVKDSKGRSRSKSPGRRDKSPARAVSPPKSKSHKSHKSKKRYESESSSETESETDSEEERRSRRKKAEKDRRKRKDESSSSSSDSEDEKRYAKDVKYERRQHADRHPSYGEPLDRYEYAAVPGAYIAQEPAEFVQLSSTGQRYQVQPKYEYAQTSQNIKYVSKEVVGRDGKRYYVQTPQPQMEYVPRKPSRKDSETKSRRDSDDDKHRKSKRDSDDDKHKKSRKDRDDEKSKKSRRESEHDRPKSSRKNSDHDKHRKSRHDSETESETSSSEEERHKLKTTKSKSSRHDSDSDRDRKKRDKHRESDAHKRPQFIEVEPRGVKGGMQRLSIGNSLMAPGVQTVVGVAPPGSPLLEAYRGTYQSISPMPSPMMMPGHMDEGLSDIEQLDEDSDHGSKKSALKKRVEIYDPEPDAKTIAAELKTLKDGSASLAVVLPPLSDDNMMHLRQEYKKHYKVNGKGINIAKHIKLKVPGNIGKIAYATALGRWESEAYWANFWYQSGSARRELLIESLIGRSNAEIRKIKEAFTDKRYNDSLEKCMQTELKKDKFRNAILLALQEKRQDEIGPSLPKLVTQDVRDLHKALTSKDGGESAMIDIIVVRSDTHLRKVMKEFEEQYKRNFAREMIQKSQNLVVRF